MLIEIIKPQEAQRIYLVSPPLASEYQKTLQKRKKRRAYEVSSLRSLPLQTSDINSHGHSRTAVEISETDLQIELSS